MDESMIGKYGATLGAAYPPLASIGDPCPEDTTVLRSNARRLLILPLPPHPIRHHHLQLPAHLPGGCSMENNNPRRRGGWSIDPREWVVEAFASRPVDERRRAFLGCSTVPVF